MQRTNLMLVPDRSRNKISLFDKRRSSTLPEFFVAADGLKSGCDVRLAAVNAYGERNQHTYNPPSQIYAMTDVADKLDEVPVAEVEKVAEPEKEPVVEESSDDAPTTESESPEKGSSNGDAGKLEDKIIRQIEYYFGDSNLLRDKFLLEQISKDEEGWVPFDVLLTFKRLASLTTDISLIVDALHKSDEGLVEVSEDKTKLRRHPERPIPEYNEEKRKEIMSRTAYAKGFPLTVEMSDLIEFFHPFEKVANITMRKYLDKATKVYKFKGSVFVTFLKKEQTEEFITKDKVQFKGNDLIRKWQETYLQEKKEEQNQKKSKKSKQKEEENKFQLPKGAVLFFEGATDATTRETIRTALEALDAEIAYIDFSKGDKDGHIRLTGENSAAGFLDKLKDKKLVLSDSTELAVRLLTEEEEKAFLDKAIEHMKSRRNQQNRHKGGNRKRRGGGEEPEPKRRDKKND